MFGRPVMIMALSKMFLLNRNSHKLTCLHHDRLHPSKKVKYFSHKIITIDYVAFIKLHRLLLITFFFFTLQECSTNSSNKSDSSNATKTLYHSSHFSPIDQKDWQDLKKKKKKSHTEREAFQRYAVD